MCQLSTTWTWLGAGGIMSWKNNPIPGIQVLQFKLNLGWDKDKQPIIWHLITQSCKQVLFKVNHNIMIGTSFPNFLGKFGQGHKIFFHCSCIRIP